MFKKVLLSVLTLFSVVSFGQNFDAESKARIKGYIILSETQGDLNNDGIDDYVYVFKDSDETIGEYYPNYEENGRGLFVFLSEGNQHTLSLFKYNCFESLDEQIQGAYHAPELFVMIYEGKINVGFDHGRYGNWRYDLKLIDSEFKLVGASALYDNPDNDMMMDSQVEVDYLNGEVKRRVETGEDSSGFIFYNETIREIEKKPLLSIYDIRRFEELREELIVPYM